MTALLAVQTVAHAEDDKKLENKQPRTWQQAAYENRYGIAAGAAALSLGTLGYVYGGDFMTWFNKLSPVEQEQVQQKLKGSVDQDLENIQHQQKSVVEQEAIVAEQEQGITQAQQQVAEKQSWLQYILNMRKNDPALNKIQEELALNPEDRSSDDDRSEEDRAQYQKDLQDSINNLRERKKLRNPFTNISTKAVIYTSTDTNPLMATTPENNGDADIWENNAPMERRSTAPSNNLNQEASTNDIWEDKPLIVRRSTAPSTSLMLEQTQEETPNVSQQPAVVETRENELARKAEKRQAIHAQLENSIKKTEEYFAKKNKD